MRRSDFSRKCLNLGDLGVAEFSLTERPHSNGNSHPTTMINGQILSSGASQEFFRILRRYCLMKSVRKTIFSCLVPHQTILHLAGLTKTNEPLKP
jgi:hypothetical protein